MEQIGNAKAFFEVFPTLKVEESIQRLFADVKVRKITTNATRDFLHVYIFSRHVIQKKVIWQMEQKIKEQLFATVMVNIRLEEQYVLSEQYTPEELMSEYRDSIMLELKQYSVLAASMFEHARITFEEKNICCLELIDTIVSEGKREYIVELLNDIFHKRFGIPVEIRVAYREKAESKTREYDEQRIQREINAIFERNKKSHGQTEHSDGESISEKKEKAEVASAGVRQNSGKKSDGKEFKKESKKEFKKEFKKDYVRPLKQGDDPNLIYGKGFEDEPIRLDQVVGEMGEITIHGKIISFETREIRNEKTILMFAVTDFTDTIMVKMFAHNEQLPELLGGLKKGVFLKIKGITTIDKYDGELSIVSVTGIKKIGDFTVKREDLSPVKRVELHCHTKMSDMDGVSEVQDIVRRAHDWGHPAIAITDHGTAQAFPDANHFIEKLDKDDPFKILYGVEGYVVDDLTEIAVGAGEESLDDTYVVFDLETTGFSAIKDKIIEIVQ